MSQTDANRVTPKILAMLRSQYGCGDVELSGTNDARYERHLASDRVVDPARTSARDRFVAFAHSVRDVLSQTWVLTENTYAREDPKRVYYLSMEFLIGRSLANNIIDKWITDTTQLRALEPLADDEVFREAFLKTKREAKLRCVEWLKYTSGQTLDPDTVFDTQVKRIHEYQRQLLNALRILVLYNRLRQNPGTEMVPRTFIFAGKAHPHTDSPSSSSSSSTILPERWMETRPYAAG